MKTLFAALSLLFLIGCASLEPAAKAASEPKKQAQMAVLNDGDVIVGLVDEPCTHPGILEMIGDEYRKFFRAGKVMITKESYHLCWANGADFIGVAPGALPEAK